jgi:hypothetical protein
MDFPSVAFGFEWPRLALWNASLRLRWKTCGWPGRLCWFALIVERVRLAEDRARADADSARDDRGANDVSTADLRRKRPATPFSTVRREELRELS